ncbi:hypothetical protein PO909_006622 [Leuciscus waleckii]
MDQQGEEIANTGRVVQALVTQVSELTQQLQLLRAPTAPSAPPVQENQPEPRLPKPEGYSGDSLGNGSVKNQDVCCASFQALSTEIRRVFNRAVAECHWNEEAQWDMFLHGLADRVQKEIYILDLPRTLNGLVELALRVDARLNRVPQRAGPSRPQYGTEDPHTNGGNTVSPVFDHEPMQKEAADLFNVPTEYLDLKEVFSKSRAASLPPHHPYDGAIDLLPAKKTAVTVVDHVFWLHGLPMDVVSDRGSQFVSKFWQEFCKLLGATVSLSSGYHPQSNGQSERANQDLERMLRCLVAKNPSSWSQQLSMVEYAHNSLPVSSTGLSPFKSSLGYQPPIFPSLESEVVVPSAHAFVQRCRRFWARAHKTLLQVGKRMKAKADRHRSKPPVYVVGQKVWLSSKNIPLRSVSNKLSPKLIGPFPVTKIISPVTVRLKLPPAYRRIQPAFHVSKIKPVFYSRINPPVLVQ